MFFYHYTDAKSAALITKNQLNRESTERWECRISQPQKWAKFEVQHPEGFYLTTCAPDMVGDGKNSKKEKIGLSYLDNPYVLIFSLPFVKWRDIKKVRASMHNEKETFSITKAGEPEKYFTIPIGKVHGRSECVPFDLEHCVWAGPIAQTPAEYQETAKFIFEK
ncbi:hypothetical protein [Trinickia fusca]|uniref:Uncharacterized protein n=1 Tax=Trinickia fusca TaxID=2419777 RepID=A0A494XJ68_9BURK|nr:hypothetical protein [Trinickia fusca]RKP47603.1 hypothetical protein D7S89_15370 [Trinickia fusca]